MFGQVRAPTWTRLAKGGTFDLVNLPTFGYRLVGFMYHAVGKGQDERQRWLLRCVLCAFPSVSAEPVVALSKDMYSTKAPEVVSNSRDYSFRETLHSAVLMRMGGCRLALALEDPLGRISTTQFHSLP